MAKVLKKFKVLNYNMGEKTEYDILPYFRDCWKAKYYKEQVSKIKETKSENNRRELLKEFIKSKSQYMFWARCEYEFLVLPWPYNKERDKSYKLDVFEQIMYNIDIITEILFDEFLNKNDE